jgi:enolase-phosphatase E1
VLLDIEGTTTPITFVYETLFPYARRHLRAHLAHHFDSPEYAGLLDQLRKLHDADAAGGDSPPPWIDSPDARLDSVASYVEWLMDRDRKATPLKELQGRIWEEGYRRGELIGEVFADVAPALARWTADGIRVAIFSSGSVLGQQLLFAHSSAGDLSGFISNYFDTTTGPKGDPESYTCIARALNLQLSEILFVSDVVRELDAARGAGMQTRLAVRPGNASPPPGHGYEVITTFGELTTQNR